MRTKNEEQDARRIIRMLRFYIDDATEAIVIDPCELDIYIDDACIGDLRYAFSLDPDERDLIHLIAKILREEYKLEVRIQCIDE